MIYLPLRMLRELALLIVEKFFAKEYLFKDLSALYSDSLSQQTYQQLGELENHLRKLKVKDETLKDWKNLLEALKEMLLQPEMGNAMLGKVQSPLVTVIQGRIDQLPFGKLCREDLSRVLPHTILVSQLRKCILLQYITILKIMTTFRYDLFAQAVWQDTD